MDPLRPSPSRTWCHFATSCSRSPLCSLRRLVAGASLKSWLRHALPTLALLLAWRWSQAPDDPLTGPLVRVEQGVLLGAHRLTLYDAIPYFSFQGIPYAKPPLGDLRFKVSRPRCRPHRHRHSLPWLQPWRRQANQALGAKRETPTAPPLQACQRERAKVLTLVFPAAGAAAAG